MIPIECKSYEPFLNAFVDGELGGVEMLRVSQHLEDCRACAIEVESLRDVGATLRGAAAGEAAVPPMLGLAAGVIARIGAEEAQSWRGVLRRGVDDWHWAIVGGGSVLATFVSVLFVGALLLFGPVPVREDSLAALISNLGAPAGRILIEATPKGDAKDSMLMEIETGANAEGVQHARVMPAMLGLATERDYVDALTNAVAPQGRILDLSAMSESYRRYTESLLDNITRFRLGDPIIAATATLSVHKIRLVTNTAVSAKME
jgi:putative zinc finger protein